MFDTMSLLKKLTLIVMLGSFSVNVGTLAYYLITKNASEIPRLYKALLFITFPAVLPLALLLGMLWLLTMPSRVVDRKAARARDRHQAKPRGELAAAPEPAFIFHESERKVKIEVVPVSAEVKNRPTANVMESFHAPISVVAGTRWKRQRQFEG